MMALERREVSPTTSVRSRNGWGLSGREPQDILRTMRCGSAGSRALSVPANSRCSLARVVESIQAGVMNGNSTGAWAGTSSRALTSSASQCLLRRLR